MQLIFKKNIYTLAQLSCTCTKCVIIGNHRYLPFMKLSSHEHIRITISLHGQYHYVINTSILLKTLLLVYAKQNSQGVKKVRPIRSNRLSDYYYTYLHVTKNFDIKLRPRINQLWYGLMQHYMCTTPFCHSTGIFQQSMLAILEKIARATNDTQSRSFCKYRLLDRLQFAMANCVAMEATLP